VTVAVADIQNLIFSKFGVDINTENVFTLYRIDSPDISPEELEVQIQGAHKRWNLSINGANEKNAERDRARLEKADSYEAILKDVKLRKALFKYYNKPAETTEDAVISGGRSTNFAKEYFSLVATSKRITRADVDFFFNFYQAERENKKEILEMLATEFKVPGLGKGDLVGQEGTEEIDGRKKDNDSPLIVNLFQEASVLSISRAIQKYEEACKIDEIGNRYPEIRGGLYSLLGLTGIRNSKQFSEYISEKGREAYANRQERGADYIPLVDLYNILKRVSEYQDVVDNFSQFLLLLRYPKLTPYMFSFVDMKPSTLSGIVKVAKRDYGFVSENDFLLNYFNLIYKNFGISISNISAIINKAERKSKKDTDESVEINPIQEKILSLDIQDENRLDNRVEISVGAQILYWFVYWPVYLLYFLFEVAKAVFTRIRWLSIPGFVILFIVESWLVPKYWIDNLWVLRKIAVKIQWLSVLDEFLGVYGKNTAENILLSSVMIILLLLVYIFPPLFLSKFIVGFSDDFNKRFDWIGIERSFQGVIKNLRNRTEKRYLANQNYFIKSHIVKVVINVVCLAVLIGLFVLAPICIRKIHGKLDSLRGPIVDDAVTAEEENTADATEGKEGNTASAIVTGESDATDDAALDTAVMDENVSEKENDSENDSVDHDVVIIIESTANIRSGPGTDYDIVATVTRDDELAATGYHGTSLDGFTWYEVYIDDEMNRRGWLSQTEIEFK